jgi:hypothetical protein
MRVRIITVRIAVSDEPDEWHQDGRYATDGLNELFGNEGHGFVLDWSYPEAPDVLVEVEAPYEEYAAFEAEALGRGRAVARAIDAE